jgi:hypothetical protein
MIYMQEFNVRPEVSKKQLLESYVRLAEAWQKVWPSNRFLGLHIRKFALGQGLDYVALWELPNFQAFDEWHASWPGFVDLQMREIEDEFFDLIAEHSCRVLETLNVE